MAKRKAKKAGSRGRSRPVRVAMVGAGSRALSTHYPSLRDLPGAEMVGVCELDEDRRQRAADEYAIPSQYTDYKEMIEREKPDAVYACMPPHYLYDVCATVIEMGCNLFIEKPPAVTTEQARQLAILAHRHKVLTGVTFQRRFSPVIRQGKALVEKQGPIHTAHAAFYKNWVGASPYYRGAIDMLTCDGIHAVDTLRYLCGGEVEAVSSDSRRLDAGHWNIHLALVRFSSGATGVLLVNFMSGRRAFTVEIHGPGICVLGDPEEGARLFADGETDPRQVLDPVEMSGSEEAYRTFGGYDTNRHFIDCVKEGRQPETSFEEAVKTMELVDEVYGNQLDTDSECTGDCGCRCGCGE